MPTRPLLGAAAAPARLSPDQVRRDLAIRDLSDPAEGPHAIQLLVDRASGALAGRWGCGVRLSRGPRVVTVADNYDNLRFAPGDVTRDARYTRYVDSQTMLRSHSSAMIPPALRAMAADPPRDALLVCPGIVYRRDAIDRLHTGTPHQLDLWRITHGEVRGTDMDEMIEVLMEALLPRRRYRVEARAHPYTTGGRQVDVESDGEWVEVWECGVAHPGVLARAGLDDGWSGLALGMGLDRILMLVKCIPDVRALRSGEPKIVAQMSDLARYRAVSSMPPVTRDLSVAVPAGDTLEDLGDRVRDALGDDAPSVEEVSVIGRTGCSELPEQARRRLGASDDQENLLVRMVLRDLDRTLTAGEANKMRDRAYAALHRGMVHQWAAGGPS